MLLIGFGCISYIALYRVSTSEQEDSQLSLKALAFAVKNFIQNSDSALVEDVFEIDSASNKDKINTNYAQTVTIGTQVWMTKNLDVSTFRNGDPIPEAKTDDEWYKAGENNQPAWCYYNNDPANGAKYGKLYNYRAVIDSRGLAPVGYHIPYDAELEKLIGYLGGNYGAGIKLSSSSGWEDSLNGTNESGFSGLPGGYRFFKGKFNYLGSWGCWWSSSSVGIVAARSFNLHGDAGTGVQGSGSGLSVRCLRD